MAGPRLFQLAGFLLSIFPILLPPLGGRRSRGGWDPCSLVVMGPSDSYYIDVTFRPACRSFSFEVSDERSPGFNPWFFEERVACSPEKHEPSPHAGRDQAIACFYPVQCWRSRRVNPSGKRSLVYRPAEAYDVRKPLLRICARCIGCRLDYSAGWAVRAVHEAQMHDENCVLNLTFDEANCPKDFSLNKRIHQLFFKSLRDSIFPKKIRYMVAGEYGDENRRPHYHVCLFGHDFSDKVFHKLSPSGDRLYTSKFLDKVWKHGFALIGTLNFNSAAYVARYITKKYIGKDSEFVYDGLLPEYMRMSTRPGIGYTWLEKYHRDVFPSDECVLPNGNVVPIPKYYLKLIDRLMPQGPLALGETNDLSKFRLSRSARIILDRELHPERFDASALSAKEEHLTSRLKSKRVLK